MRCRGRNSRLCGLGHHRLQRVLAPVFLLTGIFVGNLRAQTFAEFSIPTGGSQPTSIAEGPDGNLWFTEFGTNKIGRISTAGVVTEFSVPYSPPEPPAHVSTGFPFPVPTSYSGPLYIEAGSDAALWFTEPGVNKIGRITTAGVITEFRVPTASSLPAVITGASDGSLWFTEAGANKIGRITTAGSITEFSVPTVDSLPLYITEGSDRNIWFTEANGNKIGRITPGGLISEFSVPTLLSLPAGIKSGSDGALWFAETLGSKIGRITTAGVISEFALPETFGLPTNLAEFSDGSLWFTEARGNRIGRITPAGVVTSFPVPTAGAAPVGIEEGPDGKLWFTEAGSGMIGRLSVSGGPSSCLASSTALCLKNSRFQVRVSWRIPPLASSGSGTAAPLTGDTGNFWFFSQNSMEVAVKIVDGRAFNNRFWVFWGGLTDVEYTISVTDTVTGTVKTFFNPFGRLASGADLQAF
ncbi:MAG: hypothetical protein ABR610_08865 [Thermoanaerobaculia bacterium]